MGIPIFLNSFSMVDWSIITSNIREKFTSWGEQWLNPIGRLIMSKAFLSSLPVFQYSYLLSPLSIKREIPNKFKNSSRREERPTLKGFI
jgi:hypothetical protein